MVTHAQKNLSNEKIFAKGTDVEWDIVYDLAESKVICCSNTIMTLHNLVYVTAFKSPKLHGRFIVLCSCAILLVVLYSIKGTIYGLWEDVGLTSHTHFDECPLLTLNSTVSYKYIVRPEEREFPLAFSLIVYTDADRVLRLFRAIYRPHNYYCIHIDRKSKPEFVNVTERLKQCPGVSHNVVLDADLTCARILLERAPGTWKYWINLTGQEFPLRTNWELVRALRLLNGSNIVQAVYRWRNVDRFPPKETLPENHCSELKGDIGSGSLHVAVRREFIDYALNNPKGQQLYQGIVSDETFFPTLNHNPAVFPIPGAFTGIHEEDVAIALARAKVWIQSRKPCGSGRWQRWICMYGLADLPFLLSQPHFFANKFLPNVEPLAYDLLELWLAAKVLNETIHNRLADSFNSTFYRLSPYATQHLEVCVHCTSNKSNLSSIVKDFI
ncbi:unnamed protein product [Echinostoma caproni]|uniref:Core-2/I-Branching enzyme n=1 Tax=Echinostoma caproni TaxID=27848 RepID=A0A183AQV9_9TREM|nr:unnamed protein product [Echinostoma caproni]